LDKRQIESIGVMVGPRDGSTLYTRYRNAFDHYWDAADKPSHEIARLLRAFEVDVLIDLSGYTAGTRLEVLAERVAPVQMTYLGYPGTLGVPYVDYLIADRVVIPEESRKFYSEEVLYLPGCYLPRDKIEVPESFIPTKESLGLSRFERVYCAFNHEYKITPRKFADWLASTSERPNTALWLRKHSEIATYNLKKTARKIAGDTRGLVFAERTQSTVKHLARFHLTDLFLDTFPYGGHTTASDAYSMGVNLATQAGKSMHSRVASSLLTSNRHEANAYSLIQTILNNREGTISL
jgi:predicted O-linked N-acetylglucosamine transferase (SPINDLY family)